MNLGIELVIHNRTGLHARPARELVNLAKRFQSDVRVHHGAKRANGKSLASLLTLGVLPGSVIRIEVDGVDGEEALRVLAAAVTAGLGEGGADEPAASRDPAQHATPAAAASAQATASPAAPASSAAAHPDSAPVTAAPAASARLRRGVSAAPGLAIGPIHQLRPLRPARAHGGDPVGSAAEELARLDAALAAARDELTAARARLVDRGATDEAVIFDVHMELLVDPEITAAVRTRLDAGAGAARAWKDELEDRAAVVAGLADPLLAARASDFADVTERVLGRLAGGSERDELPDHPVIVVAADLSPSQTSAFEPGRVLGICTAAGGPTSHAAILARALGLPSVVSAGADVLAWATGTPVVLDGDAGTVLRDPDAVESAQAAAHSAARAVRASAEQRAAAAPAVTLDGHRVEVAANVGSVEEARRAAAAGAEGVGLLRTEFLFLDRAVPPSEHEQRTVYAAIAAALGGRPVIVRTLDVGGDKPLPYLAQPPEANPFLGVRGLRLCLERPALLREQLRAILGAASAGHLRIMLPMVADLGELRMARAVLAEVAAEMSAPALEVGIMIEVPSAAILAHVFAPEVDFMSIGSNDLTQYTLAMDRTHPTLAARADGLHPAVLRLIEMTAQAAHAHGKWVGLCGELGADPVAVPILVGLGVDELSVNVPAIAAVKARVRALSFDQAREVAAHALRCSTAEEVRRKAMPS
jgi:phosphocarrier protein FPr